VDNANRSGCPINLTLEVLGDRWSLIVIRDIIFGNRRRYRELLTRSEEGIATEVQPAVSRNPLEESEEWHLAPKVHRAGAGMSSLRNLLGDEARKAARPSRAGAAHLADDGLDRRRLGVHCCVP